MYTLFFLKAISPAVGALCLDNFIRMQGEICNLREPPARVVKYDPQDPENACYRDGIFYPRCKDLMNPEVLHYHNLLLKERL
jgi:hypothetical protein